MHPAKPTFKQQAVGAAVLPSSSPHTAAATAAAAPELPASHDSFHRRQAQALQHFLHPSQTLPDEAAVGRSPDLSSADDDDAAAEEAERLAASSPLTLPWRPDGDLSHPFGPCPLPQPFVCAGEASGSSPGPTCRSSSAPSTSVIGAGRSRTRVPVSVAAEGDTPLRVVAHSDGDEASERDAPGLASPTLLFGYPEALCAAQSLPSWQATATSAAPSASTGTSRRTANAVSRAELSPSPPQAVETPCSPPAASVSATAAEGTSALVVWTASASSSLAGDTGAGIAAAWRVPFPFMPSRRADSTGVSQPAMSRGGGGSAGTIWAQAHHMYGEETQWQQPTNRGAQAQGRDMTGDVDGADDGYARHHVYAAVAVDDSESESEDVFDDNGGSSNCLYDACVACCTWMYCLVLRCFACRCVWLRRAWRSYYCCCCCRASCSSRQHQNEIHGLTARMNAGDEDAGDGDDDDDDDANSELQLRRTLLFSAAGRRTTQPAVASAQKSTSSVGCTAAPSQAARAVQFSEKDGNNDSAHDSNEQQQYRHTNDQKEMQRQLPTSPSQRTAPASSSSFSAPSMHNSSLALLQRRVAMSGVSLADSVSDADHPPKVPLLRRLAKRLSRYSLSEAFAYLNVFSVATSDDAPGGGGGGRGSGRGSGSPTVVCAAVADAESLLAHGSFAASTQEAIDMPVNAGAVRSSGMVGRIDRDATVISRSSSAAAALDTSVGLPPSRKRRKGWSSVSCTGQVFVLFHYLGFVLLTLEVVVLSVFEFRRDLVAEVKDETACNRFPYKDRFRPDFSFSLICFMLNSVLATYYAVRAVRYEKSGLLVVQVFIMLLQLCRAVYFLLFVAERYLRYFSEAAATASQARSALLDVAGEPPLLTPLLVVTWIGVVASVAFFFLASITIPWVYAGFGWRRYTQGIVSLRLARVRRRLTTLQTCVQLDRVITLNAYLASVFLLDTWHDQCELLGVLVMVLVLYALLVPLLRRTHQLWPLLIGGCVLLAATCYFAAWIGDSVRNDYRLRAKSSSPWYSACYIDQLPVCLRHLSPVYPVEIYRDEDADKDVDTGAGARRLAATLTPLAAWSAALPVSLSRSPEKTNAWTAMWRSFFSNGASALRKQHAIRDTKFPPMCSPVALDAVNNETDTYIPTFGTYHDYFRIPYCNASCYNREIELMQRVIVRGIAGCCGNYGQCRLKDAYRTYAVILLTLLTVLSYGVRVVLLAVAWRRVIGRDDAAIDAFLQEKRRERRLRRGSRRRSSRAVPPPPPPQQQRPRGGAQGPREGAGSGETAGLETSSSTSPPREVFLAWNVDQYDALRYEADRRAFLTAHAAPRASSQEEFPCARANPLSP